MPRRTSKSGCFKSPTQKSKKTPVPTHTTKSTTAPGQPSVLSTVGQGMSLGAGAAIGSTMVHGALGSMLGGSTERVPVESIEKTGEGRCLDIFKQFNECATNTDDLNLCKPYIDFYTRCAQGQPGFN